MLELQDDEIDIREQGRNVITRLKEVKMRDSQKTGKM